MQHKSVLKSRLATRWSRCLLLRAFNQTQPTKASRVTCSRLHDHVPPSFCIFRSLWNRRYVSAGVLRFHGRSRGTRNDIVLLWFRGHIALWLERSQWPPWSTWRTWYRNTGECNGRSELNKFEQINLHRDMSGRERRDGEGKLMFINRWVYEQLLRVIAPNWLIWLSNAVHKFLRAWFIVPKRSWNFSGHKRLGDIKSALLIMFGGEPRRI